MESSNRFRLVDAPDSKAVTVTIWKQNNSVRGDVIGPITVGNEISAMIAPQDGSLSAIQALGVAVAMANKIGAQIVIIDRENLWSPEWGSLDQEANK